MVPADRLKAGVAAYWPDDRVWDKSDISMPGCKGLLFRETDVANINRFALPNKQIWLSADRQFRDPPRYRGLPKVALIAVLLELKGLEYKPVEPAIRLGPVQASVAIRQLELARQHPHR